MHGAVAELAELSPLAAPSAEVVHELAAVAELDGGEDLVVEGVAGDLDLGDAGEVLAELEAVFGDGLVELVKVELLVEREVFLGALTLRGVARVPKTAALGRPLEVVACRAALDARDDLSNTLAGFDVEHVDVAGLATADGERDGEQRAIG